MIGSGSLGSKSGLLSNLLSMLFFFGVRGVGRDFRFFVLEAMVVVVVVVVVCNATFISCCRRHPAATAAP